MECMNYVVSNVCFDCFFWIGVGSLMIVIVDMDDGIIFFFFVLGIMYCIVDFLGIWI